MENNKQVQKAGENSRQFQVSTMIVNNGITEERTRAIFSEMFNIECRNYTKEAIEIAQSRVDKLKDSLIPRISKIEGASAAFADPKFQFLLKDAQKSAASTERENDYDLLTELLVCHIQKGENRKTRASIGMAIDIVDEIDNDALCALTVSHAVKTYLPLADSCKEGLKSLNDLYSKLIYEDLPTDQAWLDHLDILGAIRITPFGVMNKIPNIYQTALPGYVCIGIKKGSDEYKKAVEILKSINFNPQWLTTNELIDGYVRLPVRNKEAIAELSMTDNFQARKITKAEVTCLNEIWELYVQDGTLQQEVNTKFAELWDFFDFLKKLRIWWNVIPGTFSITQVGVTLAHTNAKRCDSGIPDLI